MHAGGIRNSLVEQHPWMAGSLFHAFAKAKEIAVADFAKLSAFALTLPWIEAEYRATQAVLGEDIWPYGVAEPQGDRDFVRLSARTGVHAAADGRGCIVRARDY